MKKKVIIPIIVVVLVLIVGCIGFILFNNNKIVSTITLDINPSIEINLNKDNKVMSIIALNDDAKDIISDDLKGKTLNDALNNITDNLIEKGYANEDELLEVILYTDGNVSNKQIEEKLSKTLKEKNIDSDIIIVEKVTKEEKELAKKYNISPAKVSYIKSITKENENVSLEELANKSVTELKETKQTGKYCDQGYFLEGDMCYKEIDRKPAGNGEICPRGYTEYEGKCYEEIKAIESNNYICGEGFKLVNNKCVMNEVTNAYGKCNSGNYDNGYCVSKELIGNAEEYCRLTPATDILMNHKCYGPKPTINGGCANGDKLMNGGCVDMNSYYSSDYRCKDGDLESDNKCYRTIKTTPNSYYCDEDAKLEGTKCIINRTENPRKEMTCPSGTKALDDGSRCVNLNKTINKVSGFVCEGENTRLKGNDCIIYEIIEAKQN